MPPSDTRSNGAFQETMRKVRPSVAFVVMIFGALIAFEIFNYSTTEHALGDLLGSLTFAGLRWSTVLALAFCGIDFAGIARLFTPEQGMNEPKEVWYLFGAWLLAATMNAILTWWGVSIAVAGHVAASSAVVDQGTINSVVPIFVAIMVWVIRILIIGTLSLSMDRLIHPGAEQHVPIQDAFSHRPAQVNRAKAQTTQPMNIPMSASGSNSGSRAAHASGSGISGGSNARPAVRGVSASSASRFGLQAAEDDDFTQDGMAPRNGRPDPTYHNLSMSGRPPANRPANTPSNENTGRFRRS